MKEINIVCILGSYNEKNGKTKSLINKVLLQFQKKYEKVNYLEINPRSTPLEFCHGCINCFQKRMCPLDKIDNLNRIKKKIIKADLLIIATPVYFRSETGYIKTFIDRLSYWCHLLPLHGKSSLIITNCATNGTQETVKKVYMFLSMLGTTVKGIINGSVYTTEMDIQSQIEYFYERFNRGIGLEQTNALVNQLFKSYRYGFIQNGSESEKSFWKKVGYLDYENYYEITEEKEINEKIIKQLNI